MFPSFLKKNKKNIGCFDIYEFTGLEKKTMKKGGNKNKKEFTAAALSALIFKYNAIKPNGGQQQTAIRDNHHILFFLAASYCPIFFC